MKKNFLTKLLAIVVSAGLVLYPVAVHAQEPGDVDDPAQVMQDIEEGDLQADPDKEPPAEPKQGEENPESGEEDPESGEEDPDVVDDEDDQDQDDVGDQDEDDGEDPLFPEEDNEPDAAAPMVGATRGGASKEGEKAILPEITNLHFEGDNLYWDPIEGADFYNFYFAAVNTQFYSSPADLRSLFESLGYNYDTYTIIITAMNEAEEILSQPATIEYNFQSSSIIFTADFTTDANKIAVYDSSIIPVNVVCSDDRLELTFLGWQKSNEEESGYKDCTTDRFEEGKYRFKINVTIKPAYADLYTLRRDFVAIVDGNGNTQTDTPVGSDMTVNRVTVYSRVYEVSENPGTVQYYSTLNVTSDIPDFLVEGAKLLAPTFNSEYDFLEYELIFWQKKDEKVWLTFDPGVTVTPGTYRCYMKLSMKDDAYKLNRFKTDMVFNVDGTPWVFDEVSEKYDGDPITIYYFSAEIEVKEKPEVIEKTPISTIEFTSNFDTVAEANGDFSDVKISTNDDRILANIDLLQRNIGSGWDYALDNKNLTPAKYKFVIGVTLASFDDYYFTDDLKIYIDGKPCVITNVYKNDGYITGADVDSAEFEVKDSGSGQGGSGEEGQGGGQGGSGEEGQGGGQGGSGQGGQGGSGQSENQGGSSSGQTSSQPSSSQGASTSSGSSSSGSSSGSSSSSGDLPAGAVSVTTTNVTAADDTTVSGPAVLGADRNNQATRTVKIILSLLTDAQYKQVVIQNINATPVGGTLRIEVDRMSCFDRKMFEVFAQKGNINLEIVFPYGNRKLRVVVPACMDINLLLDDKGYCGFLRLASLLGADSVK